MEVLFNSFLTSLKNVAGAISDPSSVRKRNIGQDDVLILYPILKIKSDIMKKPPYDITASWY